jgi:SAM-dependent methyltransferase
MLDRIIKYWDSAQLSSPESSTSHADPNLAFLDNAVEHENLRRLLRANSAGGELCLDVGAGLGRFTMLFREFYERVVLLEGAPSLFDRLQERWKDTPGVSCVGDIFEGYEPNQRFNLVFASGVLYLYNDEMLTDFFRRACAVLSNGGLIVLRDFLTSKPQRYTSQYVEDGWCHYRTHEYWSGVALRHGLELLEISRTRPAASLLRDSRMRALLTRLRAARVYRNATLIRIVRRFGSYRLGGRKIHPVFITMRGV